MRIVKLFVMLGAVAIILGLGALSFRMYERTPAVSSLETTQHEPLVVEHISIPSGARVSQLVGMDTRGVVTLVSDPSGGGELLFFTAQGKLQRRISLRPDIKDPVADFSPQTPSN